MTRSADVVVVGAGIGGSALATVLARGGLDVLVLERQTVYRDRVRGEWLAPWGVEEAQQLGLYDVLVEAGGHHVGRHVAYGEDADPSQAEAMGLDLTSLVEGVRGPLCLTHVAATEALSAAAEKAGATVVRGVDGVHVAAGSPPSVAYGNDGVEHVVSTPLVVGADGRVSSVREQAGIELQRWEPNNLLAGLLVDGLDWWPADVQTIGRERDVMFLVFPQGGGRARLYLGHAPDQRNRFTGPDGPARFLEACRLTSVPGGERFADATPAGPSASYPGDDTWTSTPFAPGVVLVGDAAGYNDPTIGQGLSITMRDVRLAGEIVLAGGAPDFTPYAEERMERMRRLRIAARVVARLEASFDEGARERRQRAFERIMADASLFMIQAAPMIGPHRCPDESFADDPLERIFGA